MDSVAHMSLVVKEGSRRSWYYPFQKGVFLNGTSGMSIREFFHEVMRLDDAYIEEAVRTIFLNNSPVDDIDETYLEDGDRMALGSAMPGLVGIVMGRDNPYKSFRSDISAHEGMKAKNRVPITVSLKLFSAVAVETGPEILGRGVSLDALMLADFLADKTDSVIEADGMDGKTFVAALRKIGGTVPVRVEFK